MKTLATDTTIFTRLLFILLFPFFAPFTFAQDVVKVEGVCVYHAPENCSIEQAYFLLSHNSTVSELCGNGDCMKRTN